MSDERAAGEIAHQVLVDRRVLEHKVLDILGERQLGDGELVEWRIWRDSNPSPCDRGSFCDSLGVLIELRRDPARIGAIVFSQHLERPPAALLSKLDDVEPTLARHARGAL